MKKKVIAAMLVVAALGAVILGKRSAASKETEYVQEAAVEVERPGTGDLTLTTDLIGTIEPQDVVYVYPQIAGKVLQLEVKAGDQVKAGQLLCVIESNMVEAAKNQLDTAALALWQAREALNRQTVLYQGGGISEETYTQYKDGVTTAELGYQSAKNQYDEAVSNSQLTAAIDGVVETVGVTLYNTASSDKPVCVISSQGTKTVSFSATDRIRKNLKEGDQITVRQEGNTCMGVIYEISALVDSATGLFPVKARLEQTGGLENLTTGSMVELTVVSDQAKQVMTVSADAVYQDVDKSYVYLYQNGVIKKVEVETGISDEIRTEIRSGLTKADQVVKTWSTDLYDGSQVRLVQEPESAALKQEENGQKGA